MGTHKTGALLTSRSQMDKRQCRLPGVSRPGLWQNAASSPLLQVGGQETRLPEFPGESQSLRSTLCGRQGSGPVGALLGLRSFSLYPCVTCAACFDMHLLFSSLREGAQLMWLLSPGERLWLREVSHHKCKLETSLHLQPLPSGLYVQCSSCSVLLA